MTGEGETVALSEQLPNSGAVSNGSASGAHNAGSIIQPLSGEKRVRTGSQEAEMAETPLKRQKGVAPIKAE
jgi:tRNA-dihydrouridine synthase 3